MRWICFALVLCGATPLVRAQVPDTLHACASEANDARRLACYDREMSHLAPPAAARGQAPSTPGTASKLMPAENFGLSEEGTRTLEAKKGVAPPKDIDEVTAQVIKIVQLPGGRQRITLDNAQVWEQVEEDWGFNAQAGARAIISRGTLGGFWMATDAYRKVRVKRIR